MAITVNDDGTDSGSGLDWTLYQTHKAGEALPDPNTPPLGWKYGSAAWKDATLPILVERLRGMARMATAYANTLGGGGSGPANVFHFLKFNGSAWNVTTNIVGTMPGEEDSDGSFVYWILPSTIKGALCTPFGSDTVRVEYSGANLYLFTPVETNAERATVAVYL